jgi:hypothetical protein
MDKRQKLTDADKRRKLTDSRSSVNTTVGGERIILNRQRIVIPDSPSSVNITVRGEHQSGDNVNTVHGKRMKRQRSAQSESRSNVSTTLIGHKLGRF